MHWHDHSSTWVTSLAKVFWRAGTIRANHHLYVNDFWWLFRIKLSALFCSTHNGLIQFNRNSIMINDCNISTAMFVNGESNGKSIQRFILITQSHMITLAVPYIMLSTILINGEPFSIMCSIFIWDTDNRVRSLLQYPIWCFNEFYRKSTERYWCSSRAVWKMIFKISEMFDVSRSQWTNQHNKAQWLWPNVVENVHAGILRCLHCAHSLFFCLVSSLCLTELWVLIGWNLNWDVCIVPTYI